MGKFSRDKGARGERQLVADLREVFPEFEVKRGLGQARGGEEVPDIAGIPNWHIESKCGKKQNPRAALAQAIAQAKEGHTPVAVVRDDHKEPFALLLWEDFLQVLKCLDWKKYNERTITVRSRRGRKILPGSAAT